MQIVAFLPRAAVNKNRYSSSYEASDEDETSSVDDVDDDNGASYSVTKR